MSLLNSVMNYETSEINRKKKKIESWLFNHRMNEIK